MTVDDLMNEIADVLPEADGITISGGEPLDQKEALSYILAEFNSLGKHDILIYSGYSKQRILDRFPELPNVAAALISEPFVKGAVTSAVWKGSENQILTIFRKQYSEQYEQWCGNTKRNIQIVRKNTGYYLLGIPKQDDFTSTLGA